MACCTAMPTWGDAPAATSNDAARTEIDALKARLAAAEAVVEKAAEMRAAALRTAVIGRAPNESSEWADRYLKAMDDEARAGTDLDAAVAAYRKETGNA